MQVKPAVEGAMMPNEITSRIVVDQLKDGTFNVMELPPDYDYTKGLPARGRYFKTRGEAMREFMRLFQAHDPVKE